MNTAEFLRSKRGKLLIVHQDFVYYMKRRNNNMTVWNCCKNGCSCRGFTSNIEEEYLTTFTVSGDFHNHESNSNEIKRNKLIHKMKVKLILTEKSTRFVVNSILKGADINTIDLFKNFDSIYKVLRNYRNKILNPMPYVYPTLKLSYNLTTTVLNTPFYRYGIDNYGVNFVNDDILIFYSNDAVKRLYDSEIWCVDGTFSVVPKPYYQLYTISYMKNQCVFPSVFACLKNKLQTTYIDVFSIILMQNGPVSPKYIKTDFEQASISALIYISEFKCFRVSVSSRSSNSEKNSVIWINYYLSSKFRV
jgi:hypothetical protein